MYIYIYIYICIYVGTSENNIIPVAVFKGHNCKCDLERDTWFDICTSDVRLLVHMEKEESKVNITYYGYCILWMVLFSSWFKPYGVKVLSFLIQKFSLSFNLSFSGSVWVGFIFCSCSIIIKLLCLLNVCSLLLKCLHASMAFAFFISFLWLLDFSHFPTYWILHTTHSSK